MRLRIGTATVEVGGKAVPSAGVSPDIRVNVSSRDELAYFQDPYQAAPRGTNELAAVNRGRRFNEADLVRRHREGFDPSAGGEEGPAEPGRGPVIMDPALARAVDFLKGLAVLRPAAAD